ncbi:MAG TPA: hypothetical protein VM617_02365, partial [Thermoanaerobaculia bacterium]|nr:hypothetical protein [Thermoanaerobaculia bacterium]
PPPRRPLAELLDPQPAADLTVPQDLAVRSRHALDVVDADDPQAVTACFTSAYGRSPVRSGSYLALAPAPAEEDVLPSLRRFSPSEILRLLGFPAGFRWPADLHREAAWHLAGNSLALPAVRAMLAAVPPLAGRLDAGVAPP